MLERIIPSTGEKIPVIGLGTWIKFDVPPKDENVMNELKLLLNDFKKSGARLLDTSPMYGKAEEVIGNLTNGNDDFFYATKVWTTGRESGIRQMNLSFRKLQRSTIDLMQIHNLVDWQTHMKTLRQWKEEKKIRYIGITHYQSGQHDALEKIIRQEKPDFVQFNYSLADRHAEKSLLRTAEEFNVAVITNEPLDKGRLFLRTHNKPLPEWAVEAGMNNWTEFFLKYLIADPAVCCVIPATSNPNHLFEILSSGIGNLPDEKTRKKMREYME
jgi:diketogulonate reductase-like aldo/keto reductase